MFLKFILEWDGKGVFVRELVCKSFNSFYIFNRYFVKIFIWEVGFFFLVICGLMNI